MSKHLISKSFGIMSLLSVGLIPACAPDAADAGGGYAARCAVCDQGVIPSSCGGKPYSFCTIVSGACNCLIYCFENPDGGNATCGADVGGYQGRCKRADNGAPYCM